MATAIIMGYGKVEFDPMNYDSNVYDLYDVAIFDPESGMIEGEENYIDEDRYRSALRDTYGREVIYEKEEAGYCDVIDSWGELYECECTYHVTYVIDSEN